MALMSEPAMPSPHSFVPPRLHAPASGDGWVEDGAGQKFWGRFGAAGLLVFDRERGVLLQHRANWSHFGGTWGLPGGAKHENETPVQGAIREAHEEAGVAVEALKLKFTFTLDLGFWSYTTVVVETTAPFDAAVADAESIEMRWVPIDEIEALPLHPGFGAAWPMLRGELEHGDVIVVDAANVIGSRPNGWWKDRLGATEKFAAALNTLGVAGLTGEALGSAVENSRWWPEVVLVVEGQASAAKLVEHPVTVDSALPDSALPEPGPGTNEIAERLRIVRSPRDGDQQIVDTVEALTAKPTPAHVWVVTADRELAGRVTALGARVLGPSWLWALLDNAI
ncbi:NUDIX hydrolase [Subtercola sp. RTI3]|nr:NUDIX hydrolase [Subtercola sp. RTI3]